MPGDKKPQTDPDSRSRVLAQRLVENLKAKGVLNSPAVESAMLSIPRHPFIEDVFIQDELGRWKSHHMNYKNSADLEIAYDHLPIVLVLRNYLPSVCFSTPDVVSQMLEALELEKGLKILEIGTGTGYTAALTATIVDDQSLVHSVEIDSSLTQSARKHLETVGLGDINVVHADGWYGYEREAPYDRIIVHSSAEFLPYSWLEQLTPGGVLVMIRKASNTQVLLKLRNEGGQLTGSPAAFTHFPPLKHEENEAHEIFKLFRGPVSFPDPIPLPVAQDDVEAFHLLEDQDFLFWLNLEEPQLTFIPALQNPRIPHLAVRRPVILDASSGENLFGPPYEDVKGEPTDMYGEPGIHAGLLRAYGVWNEFSHPKLSGFRFTAISSRDTIPERSRVPLSSRRVWWLSAEQSDFLDWQVELTNDSNQNC